MARMHVFALACFGLALHGAPLGAQPLVRFDVNGATPAAIQSTVDAYRASLGALNPNVAGTQAGGAGRREINWDGVGAAFSAPFQLPANFFNANSPRGAVFTTAGTGFQVSGNTADAGAGQPAAARFGNINANYTNTFQVFSPQRLFTALGSNSYDVNFFVAGSGTAAGVRGFGAVFADVDTAGSTTIEYFDLENNSLGALQVLSGTSGSLSFLGASRADNQPLIGRVRVTQGNVALAAGVDDGGAVDLVVADDFIYGEPVQIPEPASLTLTGLGLAGLAACETPPSFDMTCRISVDFREPRSS